MKIRNLTTRTVSLPIEVNLGEKYGQIESILYVLVELRSDDGHTGFGYSSCYRPSDVPFLRSSIESFAELVVGQDPICIERIWRSMYKETKRYTAHGATVAAISAIDVALWDLQGKILNQPVYKLLGGFRSSLPVYASYNLWASIPATELAQNAARFVSEGFGQVKIRTGGSSDPQKEAERFKAVREAVGPDVDIMYDAIRSYTVSEAVAIGHALEPYGLYWFEDPVSDEDVEGCARVTSALDAPVAAGEATSLPGGYQQLMKQHAVDILMVDLKRVGGITPWLKVAAQAEAFNLPVVSHIFTEISAHLLAAIPNSLTLEFIPWSFPLFKDSPTVKDGLYHLSDKPGFGLELSPDLARRQVHI